MLNRKLAALIFEHIFHLKAVHLPRRGLSEDLKAATESAEPTST